MVGDGWKGGVVVAFPVPEPIYVYTVCSQSQAYLGLRRGFQHGTFRIKKNTIDLFWTDVSNKYSAFYSFKLYTIVYIINSVA